MLVSKKVTFEAAHFLPGHPKCGVMHGHHFKVALAVEGQVNPATGMVIDFTNLKKWLQENVIEQFDHTLLNDKIENPTAENIVEYIREKYGKTGFQVSADVKLAYIRIWETEDSMAEWRA